jgi:hypothetical protein
VDAQFSGATASRLPSDAGGKWTVALRKEEPVAASGAAFAMPAGWRAAVSHLL